MWRWIMLCGVFSCAKDQTGLDDHQLLKVCPSSPNCVCSTDFEKKTHHIEPLSLESQHIPEKALEIAINTIKKMGGHIVTETSTYCHATFTSRWMRFTDDFEVLLRKDKGVIDIKSSSRVGYSDLGVNKKRTEVMRQMWLKDMQKSF